MATRDPYLARINRALELHRRGLQVFPLERWLQPSKPPGESSDRISGQEAVSRTEAWWRQQRRRGPSADVTWSTTYAAPLRPLLSQSAVTMGICTR